MGSDIAFLVIAAVFVVLALSPPPLQCPPPGRCPAGSRISRGLRSVLREIAHSKRSPAQTADGCQA
jgi:hypothetical protein